MKSFNFSLFRIPTTRADQRRKRSHRFLLLMEDPFCSQPIPLRRIDSRLVQSRPYMISFVALQCRFNGRFEWNL